MPGIYFVGDPHGVFAPARRACARLDPEAMILLGDYGLDRPLEDALGEALARRSWWIPGNHDSDDEVQHRFCFESAMIERCLHGRVVMLGGLRVAGLGGVFRGKIWDPRKGAPRYRSLDELLRDRPRRHWDRLRVRHRTTIFPADFERLDGQRADVLVTHEAPSCHPFGFAALDELARRLGARWIVHGHLHRWYRATLIPERIEVLGTQIASVHDFERVIEPGRPDA